MMREIAVAARMLLNRPGLLLVAVLSLAMGIGINVAVFSVIHGALLKLSLIHISEPTRPY